MASSNVIDSKFNGFLIGAKINFLSYCIFIIGPYFPIVANISLFVIGCLPIILLYK
jgi:hypothetical protein